MNRETDTFDFETLLQLYNDTKVENVFPQMDSMLRIS